MTERPILFSAPMVRALLAGTKTQTRRVVKGLHPDCFTALRSGLDWKFYDQFDRLTQPTRCKIALPGDRLWVREAWARTAVFGGAEMTVYREGDNRTDYGGPWKPGIHMFRRDSRITLDVVSVRVERLQDISETDARAEGATWHDGGNVGHSGWRHDFGAVHDDARSAYARLWDDITGPGNWAANPWVWVVEFKRATAAQRG